MTDDPQPSTQAARWNGPAGDAWSDLQQLLDGMFAPLADVLIGELADAGARDLLDVGCGAGAVAIGAVEALGGGSRAVAVDVSARLVDTARARAAVRGADIEVVPGDAPCAFPTADLSSYAERLGPVGAALAALAPEDRRAASAAADAALAPYVHGDEVRFTAACWLARATACAAP